MYKIEELRGKSEKELLVLISEVKGKLLSLRFENATGQLTETHLIKATKKDIARIFTVLKEKQKGISLSKFLEDDVSSKKRKLFKKDKTSSVKEIKTPEIKEAASLKMSDTKIKDLKETSKTRIKASLKVDSVSPILKEEIKELDLNVAPAVVKEVLLEEIKKVVDVAPTAKETSIEEVKELDIITNPTVVEETSIEKIDIDHVIPTVVEEALKEEIKVEEIVKVKKSPSVKKAKVVKTTAPKTVALKTPKTVEEVKETTEEIKARKHLDHDQTLIFDKNTMKLNFSKLTIKELKEELTVREIKFKSAMKKAELIDLLAENIDEEEGDK